MFASNFQFLRQIGSVAIAATASTAAQPSVAPVADAAPTNANAIQNAVACAHVLFSVSRGCTVQPHFYIECEERWFAFGAPVVVPDGGAIIEVNAVAPFCFLRVTAIPGGDVSPVRLCAATQRRFGK